MTIGSLVSLMRGSVWQVFKLAAPVLGTALVVGLIIAVLDMGLQYGIDFIINL